MAERTPLDNPLHPERGVALLVVLWVVAILSVIALTSADRTRTDLQLARNYVESASAKSLAEAGVWLAVAGLLQSDPDVRWRADGFPYQFSLNGGTVRVEVLDEVGKIDLNRAPASLIGKLLMQVGASPAEASALIDKIDSWRGAAAAATAQDAREGRFETTEELMQVPGMTPDLYRRLRPAVTVYSRRVAINPLAAPPDVLAVLPSLTPDIAAEILSIRSQIMTARERDQRLSALGISPEELQLTARVFSIRAEARSQNGGVFVRYAVAGLPPTGNPYEIYAWTARDN